MKNNSATERGFTLIELLVVISIIAMLSSVVFASLQSAKKKATVGQSTSNVVQYRTALDIFFSKHEHYPGTSANTTYCLGDSVGGLCGGGNFSVQLNNQFLEVLPKIPVYPANVAAGGVSYNRYQYSCTSLNPSGDCQNFIFYWYINAQDKCLNEKFYSSPALISYNATDNVSVCAFTR